MIAHKWSAPLIAGATPAHAGSHTSAECREGGEFIRNAAISRNNGLPKEAFLNHLIADLSMIRGLPASVRWFARDEADEALLIRHAEDVYASRLAPKEHELAFVAECDRHLVESREKQMP